MNAAEKRMYEFAYTLTKSAGDILKAKRRCDTLAVKEKTSQMDLVTECDLLIEKYLTGAILERYSDHLVLAEECYPDTLIGEKQYTWVIDPIDGTTNYYRFAKDYAISLALYRADQPVFGLVYDVANDLMFCGREQAGATVNRRRLAKHREQEGSLSQATIAMSLRTVKELSGLGMDVLGMLSKAQAHRYLGCASLELCKVAKGEYDLYISSTVCEWDIAAARVLIEQNGGFLLSRPKDYPVQSGKLFVAAFNSWRLWEETLQYFPTSLQRIFTK